MSSESRWRSPALSLVLAYLAWLVTVALGLGVIWTWRSALLGLFIRLRLEKYAYAAYNNAVVLVLILGWLVLVIASESWYRQRAQHGELGRLVTRVGGALAAAAIIGYLLVLVGL